MSLHLQPLRCDSSAPRLARAWIRRVLTRVQPPGTTWPGAILDDVVLCASELVTSSLISSSTAMTLRLSAEPGLVRLSLIDDSPILAQDGDDSRVRVQNLSFALIDGSSNSCGILRAGLGRELWALFLESVPAVVGGARVSASAATR